MNISSAQNRSGTLGRAYQKLLDDLTPHTGARWTLFGTLLLLFVVRVFVVHGFYMYVSFCLGKNGT